MARKAGYTVKNNVLSNYQTKKAESRIKLRIYAKLFHQRGGAFDYAMRAGPVSANHTAMLSVQCADDLLALLFGMSAIDIFTFNSSRRSKPVRHDSRR